MGPILWGSYLACGVRPNQSFDYERVLKEPFYQEEFLRQLMNHGWAELSIVNSLILYSNWTEIISQAFLLPQVEKEKCSFKTIEGWSLGYKEENEREFFETRQLKNKGIYPKFDQIIYYNETIQSLFELYNEIGENCLKLISNSLGLDQSFLLDLTDLRNETKMQSNVSSSLLRICKYHTPKSKKELKRKQNFFGPHTDSTFITIALKSETPGLELYDQSLKRWKSPESYKPKEQSVLIFIGEFLQIISKKKFKATVHKVSQNENFDRISCPFLIRGKFDAIINFDDVKYQHKNNLDKVNLPDINGISMKMLHKILDLKRQKCFRDNNSCEGNWVLSSFDIKLEN